PHMPRRPPVGPRYTRRYTARRCQIGTDRRAHAVILPVACALIQHAHTTTVSNAVSSVPPQAELLHMIDPRPPPHLPPIFRALEYHIRRATPCQPIDKHTAIRPRFRC